MEKASKHFINRDLLAPNVLEMDIDLDLLAPLSQVCHLLQQTKLAPGTINIHNGLQLHAKHPDWPSDIMWISHREPAGYSYFEELFNRMGIAEAVADRIKYDCRIVMYGGYFVTRSYCNQSNLHCDWIECDNDAFTFMTPLSANCSELGMTYRTLRNELGRYDYSLGKGLIFGDHFMHSTACGTASGTTVFLSFTFGTDRMTNWAKIGRSAPKQTTFYCQPDGQFVDTTARFDTV